MPRLTVNRLHKILGKLIEEGHARKFVLVAKDTFTHNLESDGCTVLEVCGCTIFPVLQADGDGGTKINKDGSESYQTVAVLWGDSATEENPLGE